MRPSDGYAYMGLFTGRKGHFNMGVNEKGLVVARSASGGIPKEKRLTYARFEKRGCVPRSGSPGITPRSMRCSLTRKSLRSL